jgi:hypothetical protein
MSQPIKGPPVTLKWMLTGNEYRLVLDDFVVDSHEMGSGKTTLRGVLNLEQGQQLPVVAEVKQNALFGWKVAVRVGGEWIPMQ